MVEGFLCTSFYVVGYRKGFDNGKTGDLFFKMERIFKVRKPRVIFFENVKNHVGHNNGEIFRTILKNLKKLDIKIK